MSGYRYRVDGAVGRQPNPVFRLIQRFAPYSRSERERDRLLHRVDCVNFCHAYSPATHRRTRPRALRPAARHCS